MEPYFGPDIYDADGFRLLGRDDASLTRVWIKWDGGKAVFRVDQDVTQITDVNTAIRNETTNKGFGDWVRVASVPLSLMEKSGLSDAKANGDDQWISKWLNDGDNRAFRTHEGKF